MRQLKPGEDNRVKAIHFKMSVQAMGTPTITTWLAADDDERARLQELLRDQEGSKERIDTDAQFFCDEAGEPMGTLREVLEPIFQSLELELGENEGTHEFDRTHWLDIGGVRAAVRGFTYRVALSEGTHEFTVGNASSVAEPIFRSIEGTVTEPVDRLLYDTELKGLTLDDDGRVLPRPQDGQRTWLLSSQPQSP